MTTTGSDEYDPFTDPKLDEKAKLLELYSHAAKCKAPPSGPTKCTEMQHCKAAKVMLQHIVKCPFKEGGATKCPQSYCSMGKLTLRYGPKIKQAAEERKAKQQAKNPKKSAGNKRPRGHHSKAHLLAADPPPFVSVAKEMNMSLMLKPMSKRKRAKIKRKSMPTWKESKYEEFSDETSGSEYSDSGSDEESTIQASQVSSNRSDSEEDDMSSSSSEKDDHHNSDDSSSSSSSGSDSDNDSDDEAAIFQQDTHLFQKIEKQRKRRGSGSLVSPMFMEILKDGGSGPPISLSSTISPHHNTSTTMIPNDSADSAPVLPDLNPQAQPHYSQPPQPPIRRQSEDIPFGSNSSHSRNSLLRDDDDEEEEEEGNDSSGEDEEGNSYRKKKKSQSPSSPKAAAAPKIPNRRASVEEDDEGGSAPINPESITILTPAAPPPLGTKATMPKKPFRRRSVEEEDDSSGGSDSDSNGDDRGSNKPQHLQDNNDNGDNDGAPHIAFVVMGDESSKSVPGLVEADSDADPEEEEDGDDDDKSNNSKSSRSSASRSVSSSRSGGSVKSGRSGGSRSVASSRSGKSSKSGRSGGSKSVASSGSDRSRRSGKSDRSGSDMDSGSEGADDNDNKGGAKHKPESPPPPTLDSKCKTCGMEEDFVEAGMIGCPHCRKATYCSAACMEWDWDSGGHKDECSSNTKGSNENDDEHSACSAASSVSASSASSAPSAASQDECNVKDAKTKPDAEHNTDACTVHKTGGTATKKKQKSADEVLEQLAKQKEKAMQTAAMALKTAQRKTEPEKKEEDAANVADVGWYSVNLVVPTTTPTSQVAPRDDTEKQRTTNIGDTKKDDTNVWTAPDMSTLFAKATGMPSTDDPAGFEMAFATNDTTTLDDVGWTSFDVTAKQQGPSYDAGNVTNKTSLSEDSKSKSGNKPAWTPPKSTDISGIEPPTDGDWTVADASGGASEWVSTAKSTTTPQASDSSKEKKSNRFSFDDSSSDEDSDSDNEKDKSKEKESSSQQTTEASKDGASSSATQKLSESKSPTAAPEAAAPAPPMDDIVAQWKMAQASGVVGGPAQPSSTATVETTTPPAPAPAPGSSMDEILAQWKTAQTSGVVGATEEEKSDEKPKKKWSTGTGSWGGSKWKGNDKSTGSIAPPKADAKATSFPGQGVTQKETYGKAVFSLWKSKEQATAPITRKSGTFAMWKKPKEETAKKLPWLNSAKAQKESESIVAESKEVDAGQQSTPPTPADPLLITGENSQEHPKPAAVDGEEVMKNDVSVEAKTAVITDSSVALPAANLPTDPQKTHETVDNVKLQEDNGGALVPPPVPQPGAADDTVDSGKLQESRSSTGDSLATDAEVPPPAPQPGARTTDKPVDNVELHDKSGGAEDSPDKDAKEPPIIPQPGGHELGKETQMAQLKLALGQISDLRVERDKATAYSREVCKELAKTKASNTNFQTDKLDLDNQLVAINQKLASLEEEISNQQKSATPSGEQEKKLSTVPPTVMAEELARLKTEELHARREIQALKKQLEAKDKELSVALEGNKKEEAALRLEIEQGNAHTVEHDPLFGPRAAGEVTPEDKDPKGRKKFVSKDQRLKTLEESVHEQDVQLQKTLIEMEVTNSEKKALQQKIKQQDEELQRIWDELEAQGLVTKIVSPEIAAPVAVEPTPHEVPDSDQPTPTSTDSKTIQESMINLTPDADPTSTISLDGGAETSQRLIDVEQQLDTILVDVELLASEKSKLEERLKDHQQLQDNLEALRLEVAELRAEKTAHILERDRLKAAQFESVASLNEQLTELATIEEKWNVLQRSFTAVEAELADTKVQLAALQARTAELETSSQATEEHKSALEQLDTLKTEQTVLISEKMSLEEELRTARKEAAKLGELEKGSSVLLQAFNDLKSKFLEQQKSSSLVKEKLEKSMKLIPWLETGKDKAIKLGETLKARVRELENEIRQLKDAKSAVESDLKGFRLESKESKLSKEQDISTLKAEVEHLKDDMKLATVEREPPSQVIDQVPTTKAKSEASSAATGSDGEMQESSSSSSSSSSEEDGNSDTDNTTGPETTDALELALAPPPELDTEPELPLIIANEDIKVTEPPTVSKKKNKKKKPKLFSWDESSSEEEGNSDDNKPTEKHSHGPDTTDALEAALAPPPELDTEPELLVDVAYEETKETEPPTVAKKKKEKKKVKKTKLFSWDVSSSEEDSDSDNDKATGRHSPGPQTTESSEVETSASVGQNLPSATLIAAKEVAPAPVPEPTPEPPVNDIMEQWKAAQALVMAGSTASSTATKETAPAPAPAPPANDSIVTDTADKSNKPKKKPKRFSWDDSSSDEDSDSDDDKPKKKQIPEDSKAAVASASSGNHISQESKSTTAPVPATQSLPVSKSTAATTEATAPAPAAPMNDIIAQWKLAQASGIVGAAVESNSTVTATTQSNSTKASHATHPAVAPLSAPGKKDPRKDLFGAIKGGSTLKPAQNVETSTSKPPAPKFSLHNELANAMAGRKDQSSSMKPSPAPFRGKPPKLSLQDELANAMAKRKDTSGKPAADAGNKRGVNPFALKKPLSMQDELALKLAKRKAVGGGTKSSATEQAKAAVPNKPLSMQDELALKLARRKAADGDQKGAASKAPVLPPKPISMQDELALKLARRKAADGSAKGTAPTTEKPKAPALPPKPTSANDELAMKLARRNAKSALLESGVPVASTTSFGAKGSKDHASTIGSDRPPQLPSWKSTVLGTNQPEAAKEEVIDDDFDDLLLSLGDGDGGTDDAGADDAGGDWWNLDDGDGDEWWSSGGNAALEAIVMEALGL